MSELICFLKTKKNIRKALLHYKKDTTPIQSITNIYMQLKTINVESSFKN